MWSREADGAKHGQAPGSSQRPQRRARLITTFLRQAWPSRLYFALLARYQILAQTLKCVCYVSALTVLSMSNNRFVPIFGCEVDANHTGHPHSSLLLDSCFKAFRSELGSLNASEAQQLGIFAEDFVDEASVLSLPERYRLNQATFLPNLVLRQCLSYLDYLPQDHPNIVANVSPEIGVLGYSVGALAALVVASSKTLIDFLFNACQAYRAAFWIGVRVQLFRQEHCSPVDPQGPWAVNLLGADVKRLLDDLSKVCRPYFGFHCPHLHSRRIINYHASSRNRMNIASPYRTILLAFSTF